MSAVNIHLQVTTSKTLATGLHVNHTMLPCRAEHEADPWVAFGLLEVPTSSQVHFFQMMSKNVRSSQTIEPMSFHSIFEERSWSPGLQQCLTVHNRHAGMLYLGLPYTT